jgi:hypothetical protein
LTLAHPQPDATVAGDYLEGADAIARFLGPSWTDRRVYHAREVKALPIRRKPGIGLYAFKSELEAALKAPETLPDLTAKAS